ncbi:MAG: HAD family phosphatase [Clostridia bacterium]|nr:HAD family phosphatase [Clostridia bacterium]
MPPIKLIATDIDGTLVSNQGIITERSLRAIRAAREKGITVAIATGRFPENAYMLLEDYGLRLPIIGVNGARIVDESLREISSHEMNPAAVGETLNVLLNAGSDFFIFGDHAICTATRQRLHHSELSHGDRIKALGFQYYHGKEEVEEFVARHAVYKFFVCDNMPLPPIRQALSAVPGIDLTQSWYNNIEIMPAGVDKGQGVRDMARAMGLSMDQVMTLGDQSNDIPMLKAAGWGVAMGNASEETKSAARFVTASYAEEGFAKALETYAL